MEYVAGPSLATSLRSTPTACHRPRSAPGSRDLVEGVAYLHDHGIVHRDLKPANLFMEEGIVKIGDYGLAKLITPSQGTEHSESIGTCHYMAPEIASGKYHKPIDIYAIGVILYEMLTGQVPFEGETVGEVLMKHLTARPDVSMLAEPYRSIVAKALAKDPNHRPSRLYDLLPPEDAPRSPDVRIIGGAKAGQAARKRFSESRPKSRSSTLGPTPARPAGATWVESNKGSGQTWMHCGAPVPIPREISRLQTRPVRRQTVRSGRQVTRPVDRPRQRNSPLRRLPSPRRNRRPGARSRADFLDALGHAAPGDSDGAGAASVLGIDPSADPQQLAYLFGMALLGTWTALIPNKAIETRRFDATTKRLIALGGGLLLGVVGAFLANNVQIGPTVQNVFDFEPRNLEPVYFGGLYAIMAGWLGLTSRDRKARFRFSPILWTGLLATMLMPLWPYERWYGVYIAVLIAAAVQLVSPWNESAAAYARYVKASEKQKRKANVVRTSRLARSRVISA